MSRGRRNTPASANASPPGAAPSAGLEQARALIAEATAETDRVIAKSIVRALEGKDPVDEAPDLPAGGGIAGDLGGSARDLVGVALWASAMGDHATAGQLLVRAHAHQKAHAQRLADRRRTLGSLDGQMLAGEELAAADWLATYVTALMGDPERLERTGERPRVREGFGEARRLALALEEPLSELVRSGEDDAVRQAAAEAWAAMGDAARAKRAREASDASMDRLRRVAHALEHLDEHAQAMRTHHQAGVPALLHLVGSVTDDHILVWGDGRGDPDAHERAVMRATRGSVLPRGLRRVASDRADALALARARLRRARIAQQIAGAAESEGVSVRVPVTPAALAALAAEHPGVAVEVVERVEVARSSTFQLSGALRLAADTPEGPVEVTYLADVAESRSRNGARKREQAVAALEAAGVGTERLTGGEVADAPPERGPARLRDEDPRRPNWWALLGPERCEHPDHRWHKHGNVSRLSCETCGRENVASVPLHRLPKETIMNAERYLSAERFQAALAGDARPIDTVAGLRDRDGVASHEAKDYRTGALAAAPARARQSSLAAALGGRRR